MSPQAPRTVAELVVEQLAAWGIDHAFGVPGNTILPLLEALRQRGRPQFIVARHEGAAALMASAYAKASGRPALCLTDAGPGAIQALGGVYDAWSDRVPLLVINGELATDKRGTHWPQDADLGTAYADATAFNRAACDARQVLPMLQGALGAMVARGRPARVGIPENVQGENLVEARIVRRPDYLDTPPPADPGGIDRLAHALQGASHPLIFLGRGARKAAADVVELAEACDCPIVHTLPALGLVPADHSRNLGVLGQIGHEAAVAAAAQADVILVVGSTWWQPAFFPRGATILQVDSRPDHLGMVLPVDIAVPGAAETVLPHLKACVHRPRSQWGASLERLRAGRETEEQVPGPDGRGDRVHPAAVMAALSGLVQEDSLVCADTGNNTFWLARHFHPRASYQIIVSGHWRTVGFALPAAIGAGLAQPDRTVVAVMGDGGLGMHLAELATAVRHELPVTLVVLCDEAYGEEKYQQRAANLKPYGVDLHNPCFAACAEAAGGLGISVRTWEQLEPALRRAVAANRPALVEVAVCDAPPGRPRPLAGRTARPDAVGEMPAGPRVEERARVP